MNAHDVMTSPAITVGPDTGVTEIARLLVDRRISGVPVVDEKCRLLGIVSEGDLMRHAGAGSEETRSWWLRVLDSREDVAQRYLKERGRFAREVMTRDVVTVSEETTLPEIAALLEDRRVKRAPVMRDGVVVGIVSRANLLQGLASMQALPSVSRDDAAIRDAIEGEVRRAGLNAPYLNVVVSDGVAQLWGAVESSTDRDALAVAAENTQGVVEVENHLHVLNPIVAGAMGGV